MGIRRHLTPAVFLDRDGVVNQLVLDPELGTYESPYAPQDVELAPGAVEGLRALRALGVLLIVASNQPAAAKGTTGLDDLDAVHRRVVDLLAAEALELDGWRYCFHHPDATHPLLGGACACRKPRPGLLEDAAAQLRIDLPASWTVGDADTDIAAGRAAGTRTVLVDNPRSAHRRDGAAGEDVLVGDLRQAATVIAQAPRR